MNSTLILLSLISAGTVLLQYVGSILPNSVSLLLLAVILSFGFSAVPSVVSPDNSTFSSANPDRLARWVWIALLAFCLYKSVFDALEYRDEPKYALTSFLRDGSVLSLAILISSKFQRRLAPSLTAFGLGVALYGGINLVAYRLGVVPQQLMQQSFTAISADLSERMLAPFGPGLNSFGNIVACGSIFCLFGAVEFKREGQVRLAALGLAGTAVCAFALLMVEMRSGLLAIGFAGTWVAFRSFRAKRMLLLIIPLGLALVPFLFTTAWGNEVLGFLVPNAVLDYAQRSADDLSSAGGRSAIWDYGIELLLSGACGWFGIGTLNRDASVVVDESLQRTFGNASFSFHNGLLDVAVVYGPLWGLYVATMLIAVTFLMADHQPTRGSQNRPAPPRLGTCAGLLGCILLLNYFEAFSGAALFWCALALIFRLRFPSSSGFFRL